MLTRDDIIAILGELADDLDTQGIHGDLFRVGGAPLALAYSRRRATRDLDAIFEPKQAIYDAAERVGDRHGLLPAGSTTGCGARCGRSSDPVRAVRVQVGR